ncbi:putative RNA 2'-phosphotransferase [Pseudomonas argentinensis]|uniref:Probable RNA 2'-phosphotransferase n=2 Tax=Phytopseudomonas argentinensis TaxID=289370 RepID=A0A1I3JIL3_9GAMM|nr:putative RNA 2'-phosphotransferase [Pseudomonas argentinensis]
MNTMSRDSHTAVSKFLSYVLRHEPQTIGLQLDSEGWAEIDALLEGAARSGRQLDIEPLQAVVADNDKQRFSLSADGRRIRAAQGHSTTQVQLQHVQKQPPERLYHGTASRFLQSIESQGLVAGARHHVHLSQDVETARQVGQRYGSPVILEVDALRMHEQGCEFFQADNGVWLTRAVPGEFLRRA